MSMAGNLGCDIRIANSVHYPFECLFSEGCGLVIEVQPDSVEIVLKEFGIISQTKVYKIGIVTPEKIIKIAGFIINGYDVIVCNKSYNG